MGSTWNLNDSHRKGAAVVPSHLSGSGTMLKSFLVRDFQKHENLTVTFSPTVTTIVGSNERGKTAVIRALKLLFLNKLARSPDNYIRHGKSNFVLKLKLDGHTVIRKKGKGVNLYSLDGKKLSDGKKVPEKIEELLNVGRENFQLQQDSHFWFSETPGQVSKKLNEMVNLGLIDKSLTHLASEVKKAKSDLELKAEVLDSSRSRLNELEWVPVLDAKLHAVEALKKRRDKAAQNALQLKSWVEAMETALKHSNALKRAARAGKRAVATGDKLKKLKERKAKLEELVDGLSKAQAYLKIKIPDFKPLQELRKKADAIAERWRRLDYLVTDLTKLEQELWTVKGAIEAKESKLAKLAKNRRCPKCGSKLSSSPMSTCRRSHQSADERKATRGTT